MASVDGDDTVELYMKSSNVVCKRNVSKFTKEKQYNYHIAIGILKVCMHSGIRKRSIILFKLH